MNESYLTLQTGLTTISFCCVNIVLAIVPLFPWIIPVYVMGMCRIPPT